MRLEAECLLTKWNPNQFLTKSLILYTGPFCRLFW